MALARFVAADHALVSVRRDDVGAVDATLARRGVARRVALVVPYMMTLGGSIAQSNLVGAVAERAACRLASEGLTVFEFSVRVEHWHVQMLSSSERRAEPGNAWLRARVKEAAVRAALPGSRADAKRSEPRCSAGRGRFC